ncbi:MULTISPECIES: hypothetical protein [unclassified Massilia]|uniref:hypothetical protein n=1 Tax=unclassified Massilia TaxID=2609279 RepID=UPI001786B935|nr:MULTISPECIES: hypothetical protein [unclassified Massilia]MBD8531242.1 hypothetical protein [Massilia sp. CFBP 13647]MBD8676495.1 hypothetical protein [Massilia sp. CFBP 13721]
MLERFTQTLRIGVAADSLALIQASSGLTRRPALRLLGETRFDPAEGSAGLGNGLRRLLADGSPSTLAAGRTATIVLADDWARLWQVAPPGSASRMADLEAAAALRFQSLFGAPAAGWRISADWDADRAFLAAALPAPLLAGLQQFAIEERVHLVGIVPQFVAALNGWRKLRRAGAWFGVVHGMVHGAVLTLAVFDKGAFIAVRTALVPPGADGAWFAAHIAREALLTGADAPGLVQVCGAAPRAWAAPSCMLLGGEPGSEWAEWSDAARLAASGSGI